MTRRARPGRVTPRRGRRLSVRVAQPTLQEQARRGMVTWAAREVSRVDRERELAELDAQMAEVEETVVQTHRHPMTGLTVRETIERIARAPITVTPDELQHQAVQSAMADGLTSGEGPL